MGDWRASPKCPSCDIFYLGSCVLGSDGFVDGVIPYMSQQERHIRDFVVPFFQAKIRRPALRERQEFQKACLCLLHEVHPTFRTGPAEHFKLWLTILEKKAGIRHHKPLNIFQGTHSATWPARRGVISIRNHVNMLCHSFAEQHMLLICGTMRFYRSIVEMSTRSRLSTSILSRGSDKWLVSLGRDQMVQKIEDSNPP